MCCGMAFVKGKSRKPEKAAEQSDAVFDDVVRPFAQGVRLSVRARPGAVGARARPARLVTLAEEKRALELSVAAAPEGGKANKAFIEALARALACSRSDILLKAGQTGKLKVFEIIGEPAALEAKVLAWLATIQEDKK